MYIVPCHSNKPCQLSYSLITIFEVMKPYCVNLICCEVEMQISNSTYHLGIYPLFGIKLRCCYGA